MTDIPFDTIAAKLKDRRIMLIGGAGFIGHNLALTLAATGARVMVLDNLMNNNIVDNVQQAEIDPLRRALNQEFLNQRFTLMREAGVEMRNVDARLWDGLSLAFFEFQPTEIVHLSAIASAVEARKDPGLCFDLQLGTLRNVLELCRIHRGQVNQLMFLSSSTVYGDFETPTVDESVRPRPRGIYANAKYMGERLVRTYADQYGQGTVIVRPSALYGERCISRRVSQAFIENALMGKPLLLEGGGDGRLDFTHIADLVDGMCRSLALSGGEGRTNTYNLTLGNARTIAELAAIVKEVVPEAILEERPRAADKPVRGTLSTERARQQLGFAPRHTLETGYRSYCQWYVEQWDKVRRRLDAA